MGVQGCREGSSALNGQQCVKVSDDSECTVAGAWVGVAFFCCWCLSHYAAGHRSRALIAFACSLGRAAWISLAVCVCVCCLWAEWLGWTSVSTYMPTASFLAICVMHGLVLAQEDS